MAGNREQLLEVDEKTIQVGYVMGIGHGDPEKQFRPVAYTRDGHPCTLVDYGSRLVAEEKRIEYEGVRYDRGLSAIGSVELVRKIIHKKCEGLNVPLEVMPLGVAAEVLSIGVGGYPPHSWRYVANDIGVYRRTDYIDPVRAGIVTAYLINPLGSLVEMKRR